MDLVHAEYAPDQAALESGTTDHVQNVLPLTAGSYGPIKALSQQGGALTARCQGAGSFRGTDGTIETFAGDATKLYRWTGTAWSDVSRLAGGAYAPLAENRWNFEQFGNVVVACNGIDVPQAWTLGTSANFAALAGSPPTARYLAQVRDFLMMAYLSTDTQSIHWSQQFTPTAWTIGTNQADSQQLPNDGRITGIVGGQYAVIFQEHAITLGTYVGPDLIFQLDKVSTGRGCIIPGSIASVEQTIIFVGNDGFYRLDGGQSISSIGSQKVDKYFWDNLDQAYLYRVWASFDHRTKNYYITFPSTNAVAGTPDTKLIYNMPLKRWSRSNIGADVLFKMYAELSVDLDTDIDVADQDLDGSGLISLDSELFIGDPVPKLAAFDSSKYLCFFEGTNLAAEIDTIEAELVRNRRAFVDRAWPKVDGGTLSIKLGTRDRPNDSVTWGSSVSQNNSGECLFRSSAKFHRARMMIAAGGTWTHAQGINFSASPDGDR